MRRKGSPEKGGTHLGRKVVTWAGRRSLRLAFPPPYPWCSPEGRCCYVSRCQMLCVFSCLHRCQQSEHVAIVSAIFPPKGEDLSSCNHRGVCADVGPHPPPLHRATVFLPSLPMYVPPKSSVQVGQSLLSDIHMCPEAGCLSASQK